MRRVISVSYVLLLAAGCAFAVSGVVVAAQRYNASVLTNGSDWWRADAWYVVSHAGTGLALLLLSLAYGIAFLRRPLRSAASLIYLLSYGICGIAFLVVLESAGKADSMADAIHPLYLGGLTLIMPALALAIGGLIWCIKPGNGVSRSSN